MIDVEDIIDDLNKNHQDIAQIAYNILKKKETDYTKYDKNELAKLFHYLKNKRGSLPQEIELKTNDLANHLTYMHEGWNKPGGKRVGVSGQLLKKVKCPKCKGRGNISLTGYVRCPNCRGKGYTIQDPGLKRKSSEFDDMYFENDECAYCNGEGGTPKCAYCGKSSVREEGNSTGAVAGYNAPLGSKYKTDKNGVKHNFRIKEMKSKDLITFNELLEYVDLSTKPKTLTSFLTQASQTGELNQLFGSNFNVDNFMNWLKQKIESFDLSISDAYLKKMKDQMKEMTPLRAQMYVYNALLKGSGMGLKETNFKSMISEVEKSNK